MKRTTWNFYSGSQMTFGPGAIGSLPGILAKRNIHRVLVISDPILDNAGIVNQVKDVLIASNSKIDLRVFLEGIAEPTTETVQQVVELAKECSPELIIAIGGGSNMDLAKAAMATLASHAAVERASTEDTSVRDATSGETSVEDLFGLEKVPYRTIPLVCIPTTAGTGSEVSHASVIYSEQRGMKMAILSQAIRPTYAIVDPRLTLSCPPKVTAASGIDALTHACEAYLVTNFYAFEDNVKRGLPYEGNHPMGDLYAKEAIRLIGANLQRAYAKPEHLASRAAMSFAATLAGAAFSSCGVSLCHALEYPIGAKYSCTHGEGCGIVLPEVLRFWVPARASRIAQIGRLLGVPESDQLSDEEAAWAAIEWISECRQSLHLPTSIGDVGGQEQDLEELVRFSNGLTRLRELSPQLATSKELHHILHACL